MLFKRRPVIESWVSLLEDKLVIGCKLIFKVKTQSDNSLERYKARLVVKGYVQEDGINYDETYARLLK